MVPIPYANDPHLSSFLLSLSVLFLYIFLAMWWNSLTHPSIPCCNTLYDGVHDGVKREAPHGPFTSPAPHPPSVPILDSEMAEAFPETPMIVGAVPKPVEPRAPAGFFPDSPRPAGETPAASPYADPNGGESEPADRQEYVFVEGDDEDDDDEATLEVRSGRLDTLGWVSASWEPRCVILRADGSMSVQPLGRARKKLALHQLHLQQQQQRARWGGGGIGGVYGADSTQSSPARAHWSPMMAKLKGRSSGNVVPTSSSTTNITDRLTTWASNSSNNSVRSASSNRLTSSFLASITTGPAAGPGGTGGGANGVAESPGSSVSSANGYTEKVTHK